MKFLVSLLLLLSALSSPAQTNTAATNSHAGLDVAASPNAAALSVEAERIRTECIRNRRFICGRVIQIVPEGLVVDSGYSRLLSPPFNQSWVARGNISIARDSNAVEAVTADSVCIGLVFLTDIPKRPSVKRYDYVVIHGYPAGRYDYTPVGNIHKSIRRFSAGLERAVALNLKKHETKAP